MVEKTSAYLSAEWKGRTSCWFVFKSMMDEAKCVAVARPPC